MNDLVLLGDIGGTNSRFALTRRGDIAARAERHYENARFETFRAAIEDYIEDVDERPGAGIVAIAGPVAGDTVGPTNLPRFRFRPPELAAALGFSRLDVINDFEAVAQALPHLSAAELVWVGAPREAPPFGNMAVLGPGTGLGVGALVRSERHWAAVPSEGGHAEIGSPSGEWAKAHEVIRAKMGRVSGEFVLSGPGFERIDAALRELAGRPETLPAAEIGARALRGEDPIAHDAAMLFFDYLARFSGDVALMFAAKGGVFLYGGVVQKLATLLDGDRFRASFEAKKPLTAFLERVPVHLITASAPGLVGCAAVAAAW